MDFSRFDPGPFGTRRPRSSYVDERRARARMLLKVLEFTGLTIDDVVNSRAAKCKVERWFRVLDASEWEGRRTRLRERAAYERWLRESR